MPPIPGPGRVLRSGGLAPDLDLPVRAALPALAAALTGAGAAVLVAPPGTGKTTLVPLVLADTVAGRVLVAEPRRVAVRAAAARMAALTGGRVGDVVGYTVRGERRVGPSTRVEVVTTGVLLRRLQRDPELPGTDVVILDECHERHLDSDLALAFAVDVRATLRPDLLLVAASATADADRIAECLGRAVADAATRTREGATAVAPVVRADAPAHPVEVVWCPGNRQFAHPDGNRVDPRLLDQVAGTVRRALAETTGDVLVFLPGAGEIDRVARLLADLGTDLDIATLHGRQSAATQDAALRAGPRRRVVLASAVAESSLTVPGVRVVVDAGLSRVPRTDHGRGLGSLVTVRVARSSADQRAGRAGRLGPGTVYRCWSASDNERLPAQPEPEIATADLTAFALHLACWGYPDGTGLALPDPPPEAAMRVARATLAALGAVDERGRVTPRGRALAAVGSEPRLARALVDGACLVGAERAAEIVALLADDGLGGAGSAGTGGDLAALLRRLRHRVDPAASARWRTETRRLLATVDPADAAAPADLPDDLAVGLLVGLAFPERLARARQPGSNSYLMASGTAAELPTGSPLAGSPWLAIAVVDREPGRPSARIRAAAAVDEAAALEAGASLRTGTEELSWVGNRLVSREIERLGAIVVAERGRGTPDRATLVTALLDEVRRAGPAVLRWSDEADQFRQRLAFCHRVLGAPWPAVDDAALLAALPRWLGPALAPARDRTALDRVDLVAALRRLLPWQQAARLDAVAPTRIEVPSGSWIRVDYADPQAPVLRVKVQEAFGWRQVPAVADGRVPVLLHLLSPAGRPVAVTSDLASFWRTGYPAVRAELRGRYPRHPWPEDPTTAQPTARARPRRRS